MKRLVLAAAALAVAGVANGADLRAKPTYKAPPPVALYDWSGFYIGGHGGWAWTDKEWRAPSGVELTSYTADGGIGGVQGGFNWQHGSWVIGVEAQASFGKVRTGLNWIDPDIDPVAPRKRTGTTVETIGTVALRFGQAFDRSLIYVKGGAAWVQEVYRLFNVSVPGDPLLGSTRDTRWGWMVGVGYEYAFAGNWSAKVEFDYLGLGTERITLASVGGVPRAFDVEQDIMLVKVGINYRFGAPAMSARY